MQSSPWIKYTTNTTQKYLHWCPTNYKCTKTSYWDSQCGIHLILSPFWSGVWRGECHLQCPICCPISLCHVSGSEVHLHVPPLFCWPVTVGKCKLLTLWPHNTIFQDSFKNSRKSKHVTGSMSLLLETKAKQNKVTVSVKFYSCGKKL